MTKVAKITAVVAAGNFDCAADAHVWAEALRAVAGERHPAAEINVTVNDRQTGGGFIKAIDIDGDDVDGEDDILNQLADRSA